jgi:hypothetical protein
MHHVRSERGDDAMRRSDFTIQGRVTDTYLRQEAVQSGGHAIFPWVLVLVVAPDDGGTAQEIILQTGSMRRPEEPSGQRNGHRIAIDVRMEKLHPFTRVRMPEATAFHDLDTGEKWAVHGIIRDAQPRR